MNDKTQYNYNFVNENMRDIMGTCRRYMDYHVVGQTREGYAIDGILEGMDQEGVTMLVAEDVEESPDESRQFGGYGGYGGYGGGYGGGRRRFRRYRRRRFPYTIFVFPYFVR
ncbi:hypothetical protein [Mesobacillus foraminis]|uniref:hypothetical protein n=1 Tax=Mesobacillus foraminis TaxID=279826 RepID=UPI002035CF16|nr:hypothetical protein [Mesobacillus foraminis]